MYIRPSMFPLLLLNGRVMIRDSLLALTGCSALLIGGCARGASLDGVEEDPGQMMQVVPGGADETDGGAGGSFVIVDETYIYQGSGSSTSVALTVTLSPPADSDRDVATDIGFDLRASATSRDGAVISPPSAEYTIDVDVDAVLDRYGLVTGSDQSLPELPGDQSLILA